MIKCRHDRDGHDITNDQKNTDGYRYDQSGTKAMRLGKLINLDLLIAGCVGNTAEGKKRRQNKEKTGRRCSVF